MSAPAGKKGGTKGGGCWEDVNLTDDSDLDDLDVTGGEEGEAQKNPKVAVRRTSARTNAIEPETIVSFTVGTGKETGKVLRCSADSPMTLVLKDLSMEQVPLPSPPSLRRLPSTSPLFPFLSLSMLTAW